jgi:hypothetical protein
MDGDYDEKWGETQYETLSAIVRRGDVFLQAEPEQRQSHGFYRKCFAGRYFSWAVIAELFTTPESPVL